MAANFVGKWNLESSENFDEYMKAVGVGMIMAKMASTAKPTLTITVEGDKWTIKTETTFKTSKLEFKLNEEFDETTADDRKMKTTITLEGETKLIQDQKGDIPSTIIRVVSGNKMVATCHAKDVTATRTYIKA
jgi:hypothetical protein